jgi:DmsE family decaheme c-type cytochrome
MLSTGHTGRPRSTIAVLVAIASISISGLARTAPARSDAQAVKPDPALQEQGDYGGQDTCLICHSDRDYKGTLHARAADERTPAAARGCESCHGPGKAHVEGGGDASKIVNPNALRPQEANETCTTCHNRGTLTLWSGSRHDQRNLACMTCHSVHAPRGEKLLKAASVVEACATCHRDKATKVMRSAHMPVREGKLDCASCHNQHGSTNVKLLRVGSTLNDSCLSCHAAMRGPFLWEHAPVRENCTTCHDSHGSSNDRMLVAKTPMLCQRCHIATRHPSTIYDATAFLTTQSVRVSGRSCLQCHSNIHGSNHPSGRTWQR